MPPKPAISPSVPPTKKEKKTKKTNNEIFLLVDEEERDDEEEEGFIVVVFLCLRVCVLCVCVCLRNGSKLILGIFFSQRLPLDLKPDLKPYPKQRPKMNGLRFALLPLSFAQRGYNARNSKIFIEFCCYCC